MADSRKILFVRRDSRQLDSLATHLQSSGHVVIFAESISIALRYLDSDLDALLFFPNSPSSKSQDELAKAFDKNPALPVLVVSESQEIETVLSWIHAGAFDFIDPMISAKEFAVRLERAFGEHDSRRLRSRFHQEFRVLLENIPDIVFSLSPDRKFTLVSDSVEKVLGYKPEDLLGKSPVDLMPPEDRLEADARFEEDMRKLEPGIMRIDARLVTKNNEVRHFEVHRRLSYKPDGTLRIEGVARDCTERVRLEEKLREHSQLLESKVRERTEHVERASLQLSALNKVSISLTKYSSEDSLLGDVPELLTSSLGFDRAMLMMLNAEGTLEMTASCAPRDTEEMQQRFRERIRSGEMVMPPHYSDCVREEKTVFIEDLNADPRWPRSEGEVIRTKAVVIVPLKVGGKVIGTLSGNMQHQERLMDQQDIERMETFTNMVALALENIRTYRALEDKVIERTKSLQDSAHELERKNRELDELLMKVRQSSEELQAILNTSQSSILMVGDDCVISSRNNKVREMFGLVEDPIRGTSFAEFKDRIAACFEDERAYRQLMKMLEERAGQLYRDDSFGDRYNPKLVFDHSLTITFPEPLDLAIYSEEVRNSEGGEIGRVWIFEDIGPAKRADSQLRTIIEASPVPVIVSRVEDGKILYANQPLCDVIGVNRETALTMSTPDFYLNPREREEIRDELVTKGHVRHREVAVKHADGGVRWMLINLETTELNGELVIIGGLYDITERKKTEEMLARRLRYEEALAAGTRALLTGDDADQTIDAVLEKLRTAAATTSVYMFKVIEENGKQFYSVTHEVAAPEANFREKDDPDLHRLPVEWHPGTPALQDGKSFIMNVDTAPPDFREMLQAVNIQSVINLPVFIEDSWYGYLGFHDETEVRDWSDDDIRLLNAAAEMIGVFIYKKKVLSDLESANRKIRETQSQLVQTEKMASLGMLVAGVAHEINTPVGALSSMHNTLVRAVTKLKGELEQTDIAENKKVRAALKVIEDANSVISNGADRVATIVRRLRSFARLDQAEMQEVDIHDGIEDTLTLVHHEIKNRVKVLRNYGKLPPLVCYPGQLNQVFLNIIVNAAQAMPDGGEITITTYERNGKAVIEFRDTGLGIPEKTLSRIFDPGFTTKGVGVGTGLGLAICYQIVQDHRGEIRAESKVGDGTTFIIEIPMNLNGDNRDA